MPKDPLEHLKYLSGVNTLAILTKDEKRIIMLGDVHSSYSNLLCKDCVNDCYTIKRLVKDLMKYHTNTKTEMDFFGEFYGMRDNLSQKEMLELRAEFAEETYIHKSKTNRFHYVDVRSMPFVEEYGLEGYRPITCFTVFKRAYPTKTKLNNTILNICFESKDPRNKISKQYFKLPLAERKLVRKHIEKCIKNINNKADFEKPTYGIFMASLLVDCYAICRFLRFFAKQPAGSTTIFFEDASHIRVVIDFLQSWGCDVILNTNPPKLPTFDNTEGIRVMSKCIEDIKYKTM
jgi:hypothetical protein